MPMNIVWAAYIIFYHPPKKEHASARELKRMNSKFHVPSDLWTAPLRIPDTQKVEVTIPHKNLSASSWKTNDTNLTIQISRLISIYAGFWCQTAGHLTDLCRIWCLNNQVTNREKNYMILNQCTRRVKTEGQPYYLSIIVDLYQSYESPVVGNSYHNWLGA